MVTLITRINSNIVVIPPPMLSRDNCHCLFYKVKAFHNNTWYVYLPLFGKYVIDNDRCTGNHVFYLLVMGKQFKLLNVCCMTFDIFRLHEIVGRFVTMFGMSVI